MVAPAALPPRDHPRRRPEHGADGARAAPRVQLAVAADGQADRVAAPAERHAAHPPLGKERQADRPQDVAPARVRLSAARPEPEPAAAVAAPGHRSAGRGDRQHGAGAVGGQVSHAGVAQRQLGRRLEERCAGLRHCGRAIQQRRRAAPRQQQPPAQRQRVGEVDALVQPHDVEARANGGQCRGGASNQQLAQRAAGAARAGAHGDRAAVLVAQPDLVRAAGGSRRVAVLRAQSVRAAHLRQRAHDGPAASRLLRARGRPLPRALRLGDRGHEGAAPRVGPAADARGPALDAPPGLLAQQPHQPPQRGVPLAQREADRVVLQQVEQRGHRAGVAGRGVRGALARHRPLFGPGVPSGPVRSGPVRSGPVRFGSVRFGLGSEAPTIRMVDLRIGSDRVHDRIGSVRG